MRRFNAAVWPTVLYPLLALAAWLFLAPLVFGQELQLDVTGAGVRKVTIVDKLPFTVTASDAEGKFFFWADSAGKTQFSPLKTYTVTTAPKGELKIDCTSVSQDKDKNLVIKSGAVIVSIGAPPPGPGPGPGPGPDPPPDPPPAGVMASFIIGVTDNDNRTLPIAGILTDKALLDYLAANKVGWRVIDDDAAALKKYGIDAILAANKVTAPAIVGWFNGKPKAFAAPQNSDGVKKFVQGLSLQRVFHAAGETYPYYQSPNDPHKRYLNRIPPPKNFKLSAASFKEALGVIPRESWREINRRDVFPPAWNSDQNGFGACVGFGSTAALERTRFMGGMGRIKLSSTCTYAQINGGSDNGAIIGDSLVALQAVGTIPYDQFPDKKIYLSQLPSGWKTEASRFKIEQAYGVPTFDEAVSAVQLGYVVVFGMMVGNNFDSFDKYNVAGFSSGAGNHCLMIDGCKKLPDGRWVVDVQNSWSASWGDNGRCYMTQNHYDRADNSDAYAIRTASEDPKELIRPPLTTVIDREVQRWSDKFWAVTQRPEEVLKAFSQPYVAKRR